MRVLALAAVALAACVAPIDYPATIDVDAGIDAVDAPIDASVPSITIVRAGSGTGTVTSAPAGIDCGADCSETFGGPTAITLTATAAAGSTFVGWSGGGCSGTGACDVTVTAATVVTATFAQLYTVTVGRGGGPGSIWASVPPTTGTSPCSTVSCAWTFPAGTQVTFTADPDTRFEGWDHAMCQILAPCTLTITANDSLTAIFCPLMGCP